MLDRVEWPLPTRYGLLIKYFEGNKIKRQKKKKKKTTQVMNESYLQHPKY